MRHSCTHISFAPAWGAIPDQATREKPKKIWRKRATVAPYFISIKNQPRKNKKIRRKCATVARYSMFYRFLCNALQRASQKAKKYGANAPQLHHIFPVANQPGNRPQLALPGAFCYTLVYSRINLFLLFRALPILPGQEKESNQWRPGGKEL